MGDLHDCVSYQYFTMGQIVPKILQSRLVRLFVCPTVSMATNYQTAVPEKTLFPLQDPLMHSPQNQDIYVERGRTIGSSVAL